MISTSFIPSRLPIAVPLPAVLARCEAQLPDENLVHPHRRAKADGAGNLFNAPLGLGQFAFGPLDARPANLGGNRSIQILAKVALQGAYEGSL